jgi:hypothetical protein
VDGNQTSWLLENLVPFTTHTFKIEACTLGGCTMSASSAAVTLNSAGMLILLNKNRDRFVNFKPSQTQIRMIQVITKLNCAYGDSNYIMRFMQLRK